MEGDEVDTNYVIINKGKYTVLLSAGYQYYRNKKYVNGSVRWLCSLHKFNNCNGAVTVKGQGIAKPKTKSHAKHCMPDFARNRSDLELQRRIEKAAKEPKFIPSKFKQPVTSNNSILNTSSIRRNIVLGTRFENLEEVKVPPQYQLFLLGDYYCDGIRILAFSRAESRDLLKRLKHFFGDGIFTACPEPFMQIYSLHGDNGNSSTNTKIVPLVYALMSSRSKEAYVALFEMIKSQVPEWSPCKFTSKFEHNAMHAMLTVYPKVIIKGCYYHFRNNILKKGNDLKLTQDKVSRRIVALCAVLPLLPNNDIKVGWRYIKNFIDVTDKRMCSFSSYVQKFWFRNDDFVDTWCVFGEVHRTTLFIEGWHMKLKRINEVHRREKITVVKILKVFHDDAFSHSAARTTQTENNVSALKKRAKDSNLKECHLQNVMTMLENGQISVGHCLEILK